MPSIDVFNRSDNFKKRNQHDFLNVSERIFFRGSGNNFMIYIFIPQNVFDYLITTPTFLSSDVDFRLDVLSRLQKKEKIQEVNLVENASSL